MDLGVRRRLQKLVLASKVFGPAGGLKVLFHAHTRFAPGNLFTVRVAGVQYPVHGRKRTSDAWVMQQIFLQHEYSPIDDLPDVRWVVDCGANVGYSSIYFLNRFPNCRVLAVEPDPKNVSLLRKNLHPYGDRAEIVVAGVWSSQTRLVIVRRAEAWATAVRAVEGGEKGDLEAVDIPTLLARAGAQTIDVLKMDIEGSEGEVFSGNVDSWLPRIRNVVIEIHGKVYEEIVLRALANYEYRPERSGVELWIFRNIRALSTRCGQQVTSSVQADCAFSTEYALSNPKDSLMPTQPKE